MKRTSKASTISYEISEQDLAGQNGGITASGALMTLQGKCGWIFTYSYECTSPHVSCGN